MRKPDSESMDTARGGVLALRFQVAARVGAACAVVVILAVLTGWVADIPRLRDFTLSGVTMKFNAALAVGMAGFSLSLLIPSGAGRVRGAIGRALGGLVLLIGALTVFEHLTMLDLGIDQLLWRDPPGELGTVRPGRMGPPASTCLTLLGAGLLLLDALPRARVTPPQVLALLVCAIAALPTIGYIYGADQLFLVPRYTGIALYTAVTLLVLGASLLFARPGRGMVAVVSRDDAGGVLIRRLLPAALALPVAIGWMIREGRLAGYYDGAFQVAMLVLTLAGIFAVLIWLNGASLSNRDRAHRLVERRKDAIFESALDCIITMDGGGRVVEWNGAAEGTFGYSRAEAVGRLAAELIVPPGLRPAYIAGLRRCIESGGPAGFTGPVLGKRVQMPALHRDGREFPVELSIAATVMEAGEPLFTAYLRDITRSVAADADRSLLSSIVECSGDAIISKSLDGKITSWNAAAERIFGYTASAVLGRSIKVIIPEERLAEEEEILARVRRGERVGNFETVRRARDGRMVDVSLTVSPLRDAQSRVIGAAKTARDITERKRAEGELQAYRERLEQMVAERTTALAELNRRAREGERLAALGTLAAGLGHDLANLLLPIRARLDVLEAMPLPEEAREDIAATRSALGYVQRLSTGLRLMAADPEQLTSSGETTHLRAWWGDVETVLRTVLPKGVRLESEFPPALGVGMARHHLTQIVFNLVQNAGEAMAASGKGAVRIAAQAGASAASPGDAGATAVITVSDDGPGMTPEVLSRCFEPYYSTKGRAISTGMGLSLVRGLVERAGGHVRAESTPGVGTTFLITLPASLSPPGAGPDCTTRAVVSEAGLGDQPARTLALASAFLKSLGVVVEHEDSPDGADIWVAGAARTADVVTFLGERGGRCVVLCDERREEPAFGAGDCVVFIGPHPRAAELRKALVWAASRAAGAPGTRAPGVAVHHGLAGENS